MGNSEDKLINKIENLIRLSSSDNEHEARAAMMKARELMAKYHIRMEDVSPEEKESETVACALFEADGGAWKFRAVHEIAEYLKDKLADVENIAILS